MRDGLGSDCFGKQHPVFSILLFLLLFDIMGALTAVGSKEVRTLCVYDIFFSLLGFLISRSSS